MTDSGILVPEVVIVQALRVLRQVFIPDTRVGNRQRACFRKECKKTRKQSAQRAWVAREGPGYFAGRCPYVKEWREKRRQASLEMIQD